MRKHKAVLRLVLQVGTDDRLGGGLEAVDQQRRLSAETQRLPQPQGKPLPSVRLRGLRRADSMGRAYDVVPQPILAPRMVSPG